MLSPQHQRPQNSSFIAKLCSCCFFLHQKPNPISKKTSSSSQVKKSILPIKEPLMMENNPIINLKPQLKKNPTDSKCFQNNMFKKSLCNCEFLKELNKNNELFYIENTSHYDKMLNNKKMNPEKKKRLSENFRVLNIINKYPKNRLFFLKYNSSAILCKITYKNFKFPFQRKKPKAGTRSLMVKRPVQVNENSNNMIAQLLQNEDKKEITIEEVDEKLNIFSKFHQGIKINTDSFEKTLPEKVCQYLTSKLKKNSYVIDGFCGIGAASIQLALEGNLVMAFEMAETKLNFAINNAGVYGVKNKIDFIKGNFLSYRGKKLIDAVFLIMDYDSLKNPNESFCLFSNIIPDIRKTLEKTLEICPNVILVLPKLVDISELTLLCSDIYYHKPK